MNAVFWGLTALCIMKHKDALDAEETIEYVMSCWDDDAGARSPAHHPIESLSLSSAAARKKNKLTQPLNERCFWRTPRTRCAHSFYAQRHPNPSDARRPLAPRHTACNRLSVLPTSHLLHIPIPIPTPALTKRKLVILGLQQPSGIFAGDAFGETDTRFLYCAVSALSLLGALDRLDRERTVSYLASCRNFDGGFGRIAGAESHAGQGMCLLPFTYEP
jgi:hypothetical protein